MKMMAGCFFLLGLVAAANAEGDGTVRVFVLAGQSNMAGQGVVDLDHPKYYNGGRGNLLSVMKQSPDRYRHLRDENGEWVVRDDVFVRFRTRYGVKRGGLTIGFTGYEGNHHIGPELQFGHLIGDKVAEPVLLIKTAWGGKSLFKDFRPPSAGGATGEYFERMIAQVAEGIEQMESDFPALAGMKPEIAGFVWMQGWNDMYDEKARAEYEDNLVHLVADVRKAFDRPDLPIVIGELGNGGADASHKMKAIRIAQAAAVNRPEVGKAVAFAETTPFARPKDRSPNVGHGHHWFGNAESYFLIGDAMGKQMIRLLTDRPDES